MKQNQAKDVQGIKDYSVTHSFSRWICSAKCTFLPGNACNEDHICPNQSEHSSSFNLRSHAADWNLKSYLCKHTVAVIAAHFESKSDHVSHEYSHHGYCVSASS
jgi:hypothetical protein